MFNVSIVRLLKMNEFRFAIYRWQCERNIRRGTEGRAKGKKGVKDGDEEDK